MTSPTEAEITGTLLSGDITDNDIHIQLQQLYVKVQDLEKAKKEICDNYDAQRAKLQKLFIQKEEELRNAISRQVTLETEVKRLSKELDEAKSQLCIAGIVKENEVEAEKQKAQEQIATLNQIVNESVEVSTTSQSEVKRLNQVIHMLELQVKKLKSEKEKESILLGPTNVLTSAKSLAKKVVGQLGNDSDFRSHDNLEDSMKKAQEDTEVLRSVVIPLEKRIQELSEKLETTEERLRKYEPCKGSNEKKKNENNLIDLLFNTSQESGGTSPRGLDSKSPLKDEPDLFNTDSCVQQSVPAVSPSKSVSCDMCANYEAQLVAQQKLTQQLEKQKELVEASMERVKEDLIKETQFRKRMEDKWNEKKEEYKEQVSTLKSMYEDVEKDLKSLKKYFEQFQGDVKNEMSNLKFDREKINTELLRLQEENDKLIGKHSAHSEHLRNEYINFPSDVDELQELLLKSHEELIAAKVAKEAEEEQVKTLKYEIQLLRVQINSEKNLELENNSLREQLEMKERERIRLQEIIQTLKKVKVDNQKNEQITKNLEDLRRENKKYEEKISELRSRVEFLQRDLDMSETVQKDFVRLSQSLQIELEKIRGADTEVRWQHEDDAIECLGCRIVFTSGRSKVHCLHCGKIFCTSCLTHVVYGGPHKRPSQVCQVCHTLLNRETAPYFSQEPPHSPD